MHFRSAQQAEAQSGRLSAAAYGLRSPGHYFPRMFSSGFQGAVGHSEIVGSVSVVAADGAARPHRTADAGGDGDIACNAIFAGGRRNTDRSSAADAITADLPWRTVHRWKESRTLPWYLSLPLRSSTASSDALSTMANAGREERRRRSGGGGGLRGGLLASCCRGSSTSTRS